MAYGVRSSCNPRQHLTQRLVDGLSTIVRTEGPMGLFRGTSLGLFGVSNGAIQFMVYEKMKAWGFERKRRQHERAGKVYDMQGDKLVSLSRCFHFLNHRNVIKRLKITEYSRISLTLSCQ